MGMADHLQYAMLDKASPGMGTEAKLFAKQFGDNIEKAVDQSVETFAEHLAERFSSSIRSKEGRMVLRIILLTTLRDIGYDRLEQMARKKAGL